jgi:hypothetical protein
MRTDGRLLIENLTFLTNISFHPSAIPCQFGGTLIAGSSAL